MKAKAARSLLAYALGSLRRRLAKSLALGIGLTSAVLLLSSVLFLTESLKAEAARVRRTMPDIVVQRLVGGRPAVLRREQRRSLEEPAMPAVLAIRERVWGYLFLPSIQGNLVIVGVEPGRPAIEPVSGVLLEGRDREPGKHEMVVGAGLARYIGLRLGDEMGLPSPNPRAPALRLVGTFGSVVESYTADVVLCDEADARALLGLGDEEATDFAVTVANPAESRIIARTILGRIPEARVLERDLLDRVYTLAYGRRSGLVLAACLPVLLALFVIAWDRVSGLGPDERREIAILKATGFATRDVLWVKLCESALIGVFATAVGLLAAYVWVFALGAPGLRRALVGWTVLVPEGKLTPEVDAAQLVGIAMGVLGPFLALSIVPAWRAALVDPMESMRG